MAIRWQQQQHRSMPQTWVGIRKLETVKKEKERKKIHGEWSCKPLLSKEDSVGSKFYFSNKLTKVFNFLAHILRSLCYQYKGHFQKYGIWRK